MRPPVTVQTIVHSFGGSQSGSFGGSWGSLRTPSGLLFPRGTLWAAILEY